MPNTQDIVQKLWNLCHILRDDGITYHEYVTELTFLLFLKMMKETGAEDQIPKGYRWDDVTKKDGIEQLDFYKKLLVDLGSKGSGRVQAIFANASTSFRQPRHLRTIVDSIDGLDWYSAKSEGLGDLYEGLLEKNAEETKSGAGQYFTPRPLIEAMVALIKPQPGERITSSGIPVRVLGINSAVAVSAGGTWNQDGEYAGLSAFACAVLRNGTVQCWGDQSERLLLGNTDLDSSMPAAIPGVSDAVAIACGDTQVCALTSSGSVWCWGNYAGRQVVGGSGACSGSNCAAGAVKPGWPVLVPGITGATAVAGQGSMFDCAVLADGSVQCWGASNGGTVFASSMDATSPVQVPGVSARAHGIAVGRSDTCVVSRDGSELQCWGIDYSSAAAPTTIAGLSAPPIAVSVGPFSACALLVDGTVQCWGDGQRGELGGGMDQTSQAPVTVVGPADAVAVSNNINYTLTPQQQINTLSLQANTNNFTATDGEAAAVGDKAWVQFTIQSVGAAYDYTPKATHVAQHIGAGFTICIWNNDFTLGKASANDIPNPGAKACSNTIPCEAGLDCVAVTATSNQCLAPTYRPDCLASSGYAASASAYNFSLQQRELQPLDNANVAASTFDDGNDGAHDLGMVAALSWFDPNGNGKDYRGLFAVVTKDRYGLGANKNWTTITGTTLGLGNCGMGSFPAGTMLYTSVQAGNCAVAGTPPAPATVSWPGVCPNTTLVSSRPARRRSTTRPRSRTNPTI